MKTAFLSRVAAALVSVALVAQAPMARAEIIDTDAMTAQSQAEHDRAKVESFVARADVREKLQMMGVAGLLAHDRVASMTEAEIHSMAQRIDSMPAGGALTNNDLILILLVAVLVAIAL